MKRSSYETVSVWRARSVAKYQEGRRGNVVRAQDARGTEEPRDQVVQISDYLQAEQAPEEITSARVRRQTRAVALCGSENFFRDDVHENVQCQLRAHHLGVHRGVLSTGECSWTDDELAWDERAQDYRSISSPRFVPKPRQKRSETPQQRRKREADAEYRRNREQRLVRAGGRCEYQMNGIGERGKRYSARCDKPATQTHHVQRRSNGVDHSVENLRALCLWHHQQIHLNVEAAKSSGWIRAEWQQIDSNDS